jgi:hypothetical protein
MTMRRVTLLALGMTVFLQAASAERAAACGQCVEDKIAAVYDYAAVRAATAQGATLVYAAIAGGRQFTPAARAARVRAILLATPDVERRSVRVSAEPAAAFCASAPPGVAAATILARANRRLQPDGMRLTALRPSGRAAPRR